MDIDAVAVMNTLLATGIEDDPFDDIVWHDPELLRAEFDELINASWNSYIPPSRPRATLTSDCPRTDPPRESPGTRGGGVALPARIVSTERPRTQRSPPAG